MASVTFASSGASFTRVLHARKRRVFSGMPAARCFQQRPQQQRYVAVVNGVDAPRTRGVVSGTLMTGASGGRGEQLRTRATMGAAQPAPEEETGRKSQVRCGVPPADRAHNRFQEKKQSCHSQRKEQENRALFPFETNLIANGALLSATCA